MKFEISLAPGGNLMVIRTSGLATVEDLAASMRARVEDPRWRPDLDVLIDHSRLDTSSMDAQFVEDMIAAFEPYADAVGRGRIALVAPRSSTFGFARMFEVLAGGRLPRRYRSFRTLDEAEAWLGDDETA